MIMKDVKKMNTFTDFIDCTKALLKLNIGNKNIFAMGGSAGGSSYGSDNKFRAYFIKVLFPLFHL